MDYFEVEGKRLMLQYGIPADAGILYSELGSGREVEFPCVAKAQFLSGKRGKAGGIQFADDAQALEEAIKKIQAVRINGAAPADILIVPKLAIEAEHYLGMVLDRSAKTVVLLYTPFGGMDIEELAANQPEKLVRLPVGETLTQAQWNQAVAQFALAPEISERIYEIACALLKMFYDLDATTLEINPLAYTKDHTFIAADAKLVIDDNALYRHPDLIVIPREREDQSNEFAHEAGFSFVELGQGGDIGVMAGGAGIGMATIDAIAYYGQTAYNFLDLGGTNRERTYKAMSLLFSIPEIKGIIANVFGGVNNCLTMAEGIAQAYQEAAEKGRLKPLVVKSRGFNQEEGWAIYDGLGITQVRYGTTDDAVRKLVKLLGREEIRK